ncbi:MAG: DUF3833 family protein [Pseudomonadota bacterium]
MFRVVVGSLSALAFTIILAVGAAPLVSGQARAADQAGAALVLEDFFTGRLTAEGSFRNRITGDVRGVTVEMQGTWDGTTLTLVEDFVYSDGATDQLTWIFTKTGPGTYRGTREDVIGSGRVFQDGDDIRLRYRARLDSGGAIPYIVRFSDLLVRTGPNTVLNTATVYLALIPVGEVELVIRRH